MLNNTGKLNFRNAALILSAAAVLISAMFFLSGRKGADGSVEKKSKDYSGLFGFMSMEGESDYTKAFSDEKTGKNEIRQVSIIEDVLLDKTSVCAGEELKVRVKLKHSNEADLAVRIGNRAGNPAVLRFRAPGIREFYAAVRDDEMNVDFRKVSVEVRECGGKSFLELKAILSRMNPDEAEFEAPAGNGEKPLRYEWDFGDGTTAATKNNFTAHNYGRREQKGFQSTFTASVAAVYSGHTESASASVTFANIHYISAQMGEAQVPVIYDKFPVSAGSSYTADLAVKNIFDERVEFQTADVTVKTCGSDFSETGFSSGAEKIISVRAFDPGESGSTILTLDKSVLHRSACNVNVILRGKMSGGREVSAAVYLNIPAGAKAEGDQPVEDADMVRKLERAQKILGPGKPITPAEIKRLEKEGKI